MIKIKNRVFYPYKENMKIFKFEKCKYGDVNEYDIYLDDNGAGFCLSQLYVKSKTLGKFDSIERRYYAVMCHETGELFDSVPEASRATGACTQSIYDCLKGKKHTTHGCHWSRIVVDRGWFAMEDKYASIPCEGVDYNNIQTSPAILVIEPDSTGDSGLFVNHLYFSRRECAEALGVSVDRVRHATNRDKYKRGSCIHGLNVMRADRATYFLSKVEE